MTTLGMDIDGVRHLATQLHSKSEEIRNLTTGLDGAIRGVHWTGPDYTKFLDEWSSQHTSQLRQVADALEQAATIARNNATAQEQVSNS